MENEKIILEGCLVKFDKVNRDGHRIYIEDESGSMSTTRYLSRYYAGRRMIKIKNILDKII